jgi:integrase
VVAAAKRGPADRYAVPSYRRAIARACAKAFPAPAHLGRGRVKGVKGSRRETRTEWRRRLGAQWGAAEAWRADHEWSPNQLRHSAATRLRREFGIDVAQSVLGHRLGSSVTEVYAEVDAAKVAAIVARVG